MKSTVAFFLLAAAAVASRAETVHLFNGKDLAGWKVADMTDSGKVAVLADGSVECGPGNPMTGIAYTNEPLVSIDLNHNPASSTFALDQTKVIDGNLVRVMSWYDNEWGFSNRMADTAVAFGKVIA